MAEFKGKKVEDLIVAILLSDSHIRKNHRKNYEILFSLDKEKNYILHNYVIRNNIQDSISIKQIDDQKYVFENNIMLERIVRDWTDGQRVTSINPQLLNTNVYTLLICLFAYKGKKDVIIHTNMAREAQATVQFFIYELMGTHLIPNGKVFKVRLLNKLVAKSIIEGRPYYESMEIMSLLSDQEKHYFYDQHHSFIEGNLSYANY
ncbi:hypothetical protein [Viridibacillus arvi]|uniref:hypothetical protein n=1 Tax=Viridibacillus arvi TaxID=263475 RepID=UPI003D2E6192